MADSKSAALSSAAASGFLAASERVKSAPQDVAAA
jgi:hypothetical protein